MQTVNILQRRKSRNSHQTPAPVQDGNGLTASKETLSESNTPLFLQRFSDPAFPSIQREVEEEEETVQAKGNDGVSSGLSYQLGHSINSMRSGGRPLEPASRLYFESHFGTDFHDVRIHSDEGASRAARAVNAQAFTSGRDIFFGAGRYAPENDSGRRLIAHELTHVIQQRQAPPVKAAKTLYKKPIPGTPSENENISTQDLSLRIGSAYLKNNKAINDEIRLMLNQFTEQTDKELRLLSNNIIADRLKKTWDECLSAKPDTPYYFSSWLNFSILRQEARFRLSRSFESESRRLTKDFGKYPASIRQVRGDRCLDAFYANLEKLYPGDIIEQVEETDTTKQILLIKNTLLRLQRGTGRFIPEQRIAAKVQGQLDSDKVHEVLEKMSRSSPPMVVGNRALNKWKSTEKFGGGMLDDSMNALAREGMASPKIEIDYDIRKPKDNDPNKNRLFHQMCGRAARKIWKELQNRWDRMGPGNYFFALSLHEDYHCVVLRMEGRNRIFWIDQYGQKRMASVSRLANEMNDFPPSYWPKLSTLWQFYPMRPNEPIEDQVKGLKALKGIYMHTVSFETPSDKGPGM